MSLKSNIIDEELIDIKASQKSLYHFFSSFRIIIFIIILPVSL